MWISSLNGPKETASYLPFSSETWRALDYLDCVSSELNSYFLSYQYYIGYKNQQIRYGSFRVIGQSLVMTGIYSNPKLSLFCSSKERSFLESIEKGTHVKDRCMKLFLKLF